MESNTFTRFLNYPTSKSMSDLLLAPQQQYLEASPYFNLRISRDTKSPISPSSNESSYVCVIIDAFTHCVVLHPSPKNDAAKWLNVLFDHWIVIFAKPRFLVTENGNEYLNGKLSHFCRLFNVNLNHANRTHHGQTD